MAELCTTARNSVAAQKRMFDRAKQRDGFTISTLHTMSGISRSTLDGWASGETAMPAWGLFALGKAGIADDLLTLVAEPYDLHVSQDDGGGAIIDELFSKTLELSAIIAKARSDDSPGGPRIVHSELPDIEDATRQVVAIGKGVLRRGKGK
jgi:hypothetical protein